LNNYRIAGADPFHLCGLNDLKVFGLNPDVKIVTRCQPALGAGVV
jgi:hypothetical protein